MSTNTLRKGWCPTLSRPMETGDGWLVRLHMHEGEVSASQARAIADCAVRYGNGHIDLTSRGNLQIRGVTPERYDPLFAELTKLGFAETPRPPRESSGQMPSLGFFSNGETGTLALGLVFGRIEAKQLYWLADTSDRSGNGTIGLSPHRTVFLSNIAKSTAENIMQEAQAMGFMMHENDARRMIEACPGAPACHAGQGDTRELALAIAAALPDLVATGTSVHISGCAKGCACSRKTNVTITAANDGYAVAFNATAGTEPEYKSLGTEDVIQIMRNKA